MHFGSYWSEEPYLEPSGVSRDLLTDFSQSSLRNVCVYLHKLAWSRKGVSMQSPLRCMHMLMLLNAVCHCYLFLKQTRELRPVSLGQRDHCATCFVLKSCCFKNQWASACNYRKSMSCPFSMFCIFPTCHTTFAMGRQHGSMAISRGHPRAPFSFIPASSRVEFATWSFWRTVFTVLHLDPPTDHEINLMLYFLRL